MMKCYFSLLDVFLLQENQQYHSKQYLAADIVRAEAVIDRLGTLRKVSGFSPGRFRVTVHYPFAIVSITAFIP